LSFVCHDPSLPPNRAERRRLGPFDPHNFKFGTADTAPIAAHKRAMASGSAATMAINFAHGAELQCLAHNFSTKCLLMDRSVPTLCIDALLREASNWTMCRC